MNRRSLLWVVVAALALAVAAAPAEAGGRGGGGPGGGGSPGGGGGSRPGGSWQGGQGSHWSGGWNGGWNRGWHGGGWRGPSLGFHFGLPAFWGWPFYDLAWSVPSSSFVSQDPEVFVFQDPETIPLPSPDAQVPVTYWFYCTEPAGYFPYVQSCSLPWIPVLPQSVAPAPSAPVQ